MWWRKKDRAPGEPVKRMASLYARKGEIYVHACCPTMGALWTACDPVLKMSLASDREIGDGIAAALEGSARPDPMMWMNLGPMLRLAGLKSEGGFYRGVTSVTVVEKGGVAALEPCSRLDGGWASDPTRAVKVPVGERERLGLEARRMLTGTP